jgi:hypothetical protein
MENESIEKTKEIEQKEKVIVPETRKTRKKREKNSEKQLEALQKGREKLKSRHIQRKIEKEEESEAMKTLIMATKKHSEILNELRKTIQIPHNSPVPSPPSSPIPPPPVLKRTTRIFV